MGDKEEGMRGGATERSNKVGADDVRVDGHTERDTHSRERGTEEKSNEKELRNRVS